MKIYIVISRLEGEEESTVDVFTNEEEASKAYDRMMDEELPERVWLEWAGEYEVPCSNS